MAFFPPNSALHSWTLLAHRPRYRSAVSGLHSTRLLRCALESFFDARPSSSGAVINGQQHEHLCNGNGKNNIAPFCKLPGVFFKLERFRLFFNLGQVHSIREYRPCFARHVRSSMRPGQSSSQCHSVARSLFCTHGCPMCYTWPQQLSSIKPSCRAFPFFDLLSFACASEA